MNDFANSSLGLGIVTSVLIVVGVYTIQAARRRLKRVIQTREPMSLTSQYESFPKGEVEFDEYVAVYTAIAAILSRDVTSLRLTDSFSEHWSELDVHDLLFALYRKFGIPSRAQAFDVSGGGRKVETIGDVVHHIHEERRRSRTDQRGRGVVIE